MNNNSILIVEDDDTMREMLRYNILQNGYSADAVSDGQSCLSTISEKNYDLILLDLMLPGIDGLTLCKEIRERTPGTKVIIVSAKSEQESKLSGFQLGADDYVTKPFSMEELLARIKANLRKKGRESDIGKSNIAFGDIVIDSENFTVKVSGDDIYFSAKEFQLLKLLATNNAKVLSRQNLAEKIWDYSHLGDTRTIDVHIKNIRKKLEAKSNFKYIHTVRGIGYKFKTAPIED